MCAAGIRAFVPPARGALALRRIRDALLPLLPTMAEPDYAGAFRTLAAHFSETFPQLEGIGFTHRWGEELDTDREGGVIRNLAHAYSKDGGLAVLSGNIALDGCIVKTAGVDEEPPGKRDAERVRRWPAGDDRA